LDGDAGFNTIDGFPSDSGGPLRVVTTSDWVQSDFVFDKELPESLFSTEPPKGYSVHTEKIYGLRP
jgi:hypothetical protein